MRIFRAALLASVCCVISFAQQTENRTLPEKRLSVLDVAQMQPHILETLKQPTQASTAEKLRLQGIETVPEMRLVIKDGAVYMMVTNDTLIPMSGGGASGCLPQNSKNAGQMISLPSETGKDPAKKN